MEESKNPLEGAPEVPDLTADQLRHEFKLFLDTFRSGYPVIPAIKSIRTIFSTPGATYGLKDAKDLFEATIGRIVREAQRNDVAQLKSDLEYERKRLADRERNMEEGFRRCQELEDMVDSLKEQLVAATNRASEEKAQADTFARDVVLLAECLDATGFPSEAINRIVGSEVV